MNETVKITLASASPRRKQLLTDAGFKVDVSPTHAEENADLTLPPAKYAMELAEIKCTSHALFGKAELLVSADTIVVLDGKILNKPKDKEEAKTMLNNLSGKTHEVITAVCIRSPYRKELFYDSTKVSFHVLSQEEIEYYIENYKPFDKAGSYGIQEWIGYRGISSIEGCYYNVMGFPVAKFCQILKSF